KGVKFYWAIACRDAEHKTAARELIDGRRSFGNIQRMPQWKHNAPCGQGNSARVSSQDSQIHPWIEDLSHIAEGRIVQRYVANPERCETQFLRSSCKREMIAHRRNTAPIGFYGNKYTECQAPLGKHGLKS